MGHKRRRFGPLAAGAALAAAPVPALGQTVLEAPAILPVVERPCESKEEDIVVCGRREERRSPYRLPEPPPRFDAGGNDKSVSRERHSLYEQGDTGIHSCSTVGPGGWTGCTFKAWKDGYEQWGGKPPWERKRPTDFPDR